MAVNSKRGIWGIGELFDNHKKAIENVPRPGDVLSVPVRAAKQVFQTGKYLANEGMGAATGIKFPGIEAASEPIFRRVTDRIGKIGETLKSEMIAHGATTTAPSQRGKIMSSAQAAEIPKPLGTSPKLSRMSNGQLPGNYVAEKGGVNNALDSIMNAESSQPKPLGTSPEAAPTKTTPSDTGAGFAIVDGRRINYSDIGTSRDPLKKNGGFAMAGSVPGIGEIPADPAIGAMEREVRRIQGVQDEANLAGIGYMQPKAARRSIAFRQHQQDLDQRGDLVAIAAQKEANDTDYKNRALAINAPLIEAQAANNLAEGRAKEFAISPEGVKQAQSKGEAADYKENVNRYFNMVKERNLPQSWAGKHMEIAKKYANADDPANDYGIFFNPDTPDSMGIGTSKKLFLPILQDYMKKGYSQGDAMARAFRYLQGLEKTKGKLYEDVPNIHRLPSETKPQY